MVRAKKSVSVNEIAGERICYDLATALNNNNLVVTARLLGLCEALLNQSATGGSVLLESGERQEKEVADVVAATDRCVCRCLLR